MSEFTLIPALDDVTMTNLPLADRHAQWLLDRDEAATLWYALSEYKGSLEREVAVQNDNAYSASIEELASVYLFLSKVTKLMFELRDDHTENVAPIVRQWLDTD